MNFLYYLASICTIFISLIFYYPNLLYIFLFILYSLILIAVAIFATIYVHYILTTKEKPIHNSSHSQYFNHSSRPSIFNEIETTLISKSSITKPKNSNLSLIYGRTVDNLLQQIIEYTLRDFVSPWLKMIVTKPEIFINMLKEDMWSGIQKLHERASKIDAPKLISVDFVIKATVHLEKIRIAEARASETQQSTNLFATSSYLATNEKELEFLKKISEIIIILLLPRGYSLSPIKDLLSEIISYKLLYPMINIVTSPDYLNQKIVSFIENKLAAAAINKRSYEYALSYDGFLKLINNSSSTDELLLLRTSIINDIIEATTIQNSQKIKSGASGDEDNTLSKSEIVTALKIKRYIQQLSFAKSQCEKNLTKLGWEGNFNQDLNFSLLDILSTVVGRRHFTVFLEPLNASALVGYYTTVEELKCAPKSQTHQLGVEIFYTYIRAPNSIINVDKTVRKKMEAFLLGDTGPEVFYDLQDDVWKTMEEKYLPSFLMSEEYKKLKDILSSEENHFKEKSLNNSNESNPLAKEDEALGCDADDALDLSNHSTYARNKLEQLQEKFFNKNKALEALKSSLKPESKVLNFLEKDLESLESEKRHLEAHLTRTEVWCEYIGKWRATVENVTVSDDIESPQFTIVVQADETTIDNTNMDIKNDPESISTGWIVLRTLTQFYDLNRKLRPMCQELRSVELPSNNAFKLFFLKNDKASLEKAKLLIQKYLDFILNDEILRQSEALYAFFSPSSEKLKEIVPIPKKSKFSFSTLFKSSDSNKSDSFWSSNRLSNESNNGNGAMDDEDLTMNFENINLLNDSAGSSNSGNNKSQADIDQKDSIAEPLYALMGEIFDMGGVFKWLRRSLISFVQITYGRTINRQIRESINYLFEEPMLHSYASSLLKSFWPGGVLATKYPERTEDMKEMTLNASKSLVIDNIPEILCNLLGAQTAKHGSIKILNNIQNPIYNKQLFYDMFEILMVELFPEIKQLKPQQLKRDTKNL